MQEKNQHGLRWFESHLLSPHEGLVHGFFTRLGGVSSGVFSSLNVGLSSGDKKEAVYTNRKKIQEVLGVERLLIPFQKHGTKIVCYPEEEALLDVECDAIITKTKRVGLLIQTADCQAAIFYDPKLQCIANVHCGWRGNIAQIYTQVISKMVSYYGCDPKEILASISPSLGPEHAEFIHLEKEFPPSYWKYAKNTYMDLWQLSLNELKEAGLQEKNIEIAKICSYKTQDLFFSYRREKTTGRNATVVALI